MKLPRNPDLNTGESTPVDTSTPLLPQDAPTPGLQKAPGKMRVSKKRRKVELTDAVTREQQEQMVRRQMILPKKGSFASAKPWNPITSSDVVIPQQSDRDVRRIHVIEAVSDHSDFIVVSVEGIQYDLILPKSIPSGLQAKLIHESAKRIKSSETRASVWDERLRRLSPGRLKTVLDHAARIVIDVQANPNEKEMSVRQIQAALEVDPILTLDVIASARTNKAAADAEIERLKRELATAQSDFNGLANAIETLRDTLTEIGAIAKKDRLPRSVEEWKRAMGRVMARNARRFKIEEFYLHKSEEEVEKQLSEIVDEIKTELSFILPWSILYPLEKGIDLVLDNSDIFDISNKNSSIYPLFFYIVDVLAKFKIISNNSKKEDEGSLPTTERERENFKNLLKAYLAAAGVPESERGIVFQKLEIEIARIVRPKWSGRLERGGALATLSAPLFLKRVHADYIGRDGTVENETIRAIDPDLMRAVESYVSNRKSRPDGDMGDAKDLQFILAQPSKSIPRSKADKLTY